MSLNNSDISPTENKPHPGINNGSGNSSDSTIQPEDTTSTVNKAWFELAQTSPYCTGKAIEHLSQADRYRRDEKTGLEIHHLGRADHYLKLEVARLRKGLS